MYRYIKAIRIILHLAHVSAIQSANSNVHRSLKDNPKECFTNKVLVNDMYAVEKGWYRVMGQFNSILQGTPDTHHSALTFCGAAYGGTLESEHPTIDEKMVEIDVCFRKCFHADCPCDEHKETIYVRNCITHFIYWLPPTGSKRAFCLGKISLQQYALVNVNLQAIECRRHGVFASHSKHHPEPLRQYEGWFRFSATSGLELASQCSDALKVRTNNFHECETDFRGWIMGTHPTLDEGRVLRKVCFSYALQCDCMFYSSIYVRNCTKFFVYRVTKTPIESGSYCGATRKSTVGNTSVVALVSSSSSTQERDEICSNYTVIYDPDRLWSSTTPLNENCDALLYGNFRFGSKYTAWSIKEKCNKTDTNIHTYRCGARYQGYMEGSHPSVSEKYVQRIICFQEESSPCECSFTVIIGVRNCGGFYVYDLRGVPRCSARFCMVANGTESIRIALDRPPLYPIPVLPGIQVPTKSSTEETNNRSEVLTMKSLSIALLTFLIILVGVVMVLIVALRKIYHNKDPLEIGRNFSIRQKCCLSFASSSLVKKRRSFDRSSISECDEDQIRYQVFSPSAPIMTLTKEGGDVLGDTENSVGNMEARI